MLNPDKYTDACVDRAFVRNLHVTYRSLTLWRMPMRAMEAETFSGYGGLRQTELPKPQPAEDRVLVRVTAAGVTPLDHTILSGGHPRAKPPLVLGNEGAGVIEDAGDSGLAGCASCRYSMMMMVSTMLRSLSTSSGNLQRPAVYASPLAFEWQPQAPTC